MTTITKKFVKTIAKKDKSCYSCNKPWLAGTDIYLMEDILTTRFELVCVECGDNLSAMKGIVPTDTMPRPTFPKPSISFTDLGGSSSSPDQKLEEIKALVTDLSAKIERLDSFIRSI